MKRLYASKLNLVVTSGIECNQLCKHEIGIVVDCRYCCGGGLGIEFRVLWLAGRSNSFLGWLVLVWCWFVVWSVRVAGGLPAQLRSHAY